MVISLPSAQVVGGVARRSSTQAEAEASENRDLEPDALGSVGGYV
jgi:hypothetical protein